jgi:hypothetical protein
MLIGNPELWSRDTKPRENSSQLAKFEPIRTILSGLCVGIVKGEVKNATSRHG